MPHYSLRARLRPGRAHAPEGGPSEPEAGPEAAAGYILNNSGFRPIGGSTPEGVV